MNLLLLSIYIVLITASNTTKRKRRHLCDSSDLDESPILRFILTSFKKNDDDVTSSSKNQCEINSYINEYIKSSFKSIQKQNNEINSNSVICGESNKLPECTKHWRKRLCHLGESDMNNVDGRLHAHQNSKI